MSAAGEYAVIGRKTPKSDAVAKVTGEARYAPGAPEFNHLGPQNQVLALSA